MTPTPCCHHPDGSANFDSLTLGPVEDPHDAQATIGGRVLPAKAGFRRCSTCGARHYFMSVDPIPLGIAGAALN